ncbi:polysaccharide deacetylase family protein [Stieleria varia]|uniref:Polysaccharide deacetylase n=1 Tax=Stieleria varia TaxID=2528005 RepID=A0A5C6A3J3_9BACT|nr:polysaccharide deacetylase family protein [Stieleria varia]TWT94474.1 Polysaccharide deacetylase [Stieleria varia]
MSCPSACYASFFAAVLAAMLSLAASADDPANPVSDASQVSSSPQPLKIPDKLVVLTFDDSAISHYTHVAPLLQKYGFGATFFITEGFEFTTNKDDYMTWEQILALHDAGFEIGNHTRRHVGVNRQKPSEIDADIEYIEQRCEKHGIPKPTSFCYPGYATSDDAVQVLRRRGYRFARAGGSRAYDPKHDDALLIPQAFDSKPESTLEQFVAACELATDGKIAVMTFHGIPDTPHPWVSTDEMKFEQYLRHLATNHFQAVALREISKYVSQR